jgi:hypothetical protein
MKDVGVSHDSPMVLASATRPGGCLPSGGQLTGHADFFNAWNQTALAHLVDVCFHDRPCNDPRRPD